MKYLILIFLISINCFCSIGSFSPQSATRTNNSIHSGDHYFIKTFVETTGADSTAKFMFLTPSAVTRIHANAVMSASGDYVIQIYESATASNNGTPVTGFNNNRDSTKIAKLLPFATPTISDNGTLMWQTRIGSTSPVGSAGVSNSFGYEILAKSNTKYLFLITKQDAGDGYVDFDFFWIEHN